MEIYQYIVSQFFGIIIFLTFLNKAIAIKEKSWEEGLSEYEDFLEGFYILCCVVFLMIPIPLSLVVNRFCLGF